ncbi:MAG: LOG family protein, partial [Streptosporangiaceae bacterium]
AELGDAFVALPGGLGTLEELTEALTWRQLGLHAKPVILLDAGGFWTPLLALLDAQVDDGFVPAASRTAIQYATSPAQILATLLPA